MKISELKELEGQNVFFKNPLGYIQEVKVKRIYLGSRMVVYSIKNYNFKGSYEKMKRQYLLLKNNENISKVLVFKLSPQQIDTSDWGS